jgi:hypothetical protein
LQLTAYVRVPTGASPALTTSKEIEKSSSVIKYQVKLASSCEWHPEVQASPKKKKKERSPQHFRYRLWFPVIPYDPGFPRDPLRPWVSTKSWLGQSPPVLAIPVVKRNVLMTPGFFPVIAYDPGFPVIPYDPGFPRDPLRPWISPSSLGAQVAPMAAPFRIVSRTRRRRSSVPVAQVTQWSEFGWSDFG